MNHLNLSSAARWGDCLFIDTRLQSKQINRPAEDPLPSVFTGIVYSYCVQILLNAFDMIAVRHMKVNPKAFTFM
jgi:hypothetical protein